MQTIETAHGVTVSYAKQGSGPPLVLVHGGFSDHKTNWEFVLPHWERQFTVYAIARRGRGETDATEGHSVEDEIADAVSVIQSVGEPVFLLGHSYGAHVALGAACAAAGRVRKLVLYEAPRPSIAGGRVPEPMIAYAAAGDWDAFSFWFFHNLLLVPKADLEALRTTDLWPPILEDAKASLGDIHALCRYDFRPERFARLSMPVLLQTGSESPRHLYVTDSLAAILPDVQVDAFAGEAHEAMTTAPERYAHAVSGFLGTAS